MRLLLLPGAVHVQQDYTFGCVSLCMYGTCDPKIDLLSALLFESKHICADASVGIANLCIIAGPATHAVQ